MAHGDGAAPAGPPIEEPRVFGSVVRASSVGDEGHLLHNLGEELAAAQKAAAAKDEYSCDAISWAARNGRQGVVGLLIKKEVDLESKSFGGMRPLHHAVNSNEEVIIKELLSKGVDVNAVDESGNTPLHYACRRGVMGICQILIERKGDVTAKNALGMTPLHVACNNGHASVVQYLLQKDAEPNDADKNGNTPLHIAARTGFKDVVKVLIAGGAKTSSNRAGKTPDQLAEGDIAAMIAAIS